MGFGEGETPPQPRAARNRVRIMVTRQVPDERASPSHPTDATITDERLAALEGGRHGGLPLRIGGAFIGGPMAGRHGGPSSTNVGAFIGSVQGGVGTSVSSQGLVLVWVSESENSLLREGQRITE